MRNSDGRAETGVGCVLVNEARVVREAQAEVEGQPFRGFVLIFEEQSL